MADPPRVLFLGMLGAFSRVVLESALRSGINLCGVVVPGAFPFLPRRERVRERVSDGLPILRPEFERTILDVADQGGICVLEVAEIGAEDALAALRQLQPDVIAVACWPRLIPHSVREVVGLAVNVHPSLLPENRGPEPLFWTFRLGQQRTGVTVHVLEDRADSGAILAQCELPVPDGIHGAELELQLARAGGELLAQVVAQFAAGSLRPLPQDETRASYDPAPAPEDWTIPAGWSEHQKTNFIRGVAHLRGPLQAG